MATASASCVIAAAPARVWAVLRDFNALPSWHPLVASSRIEAGMAADQVGCVRNFTMHDGATLRERLLGLSDYDMTCTYSILESSLQLTDYVATLGIIPVTHGNASFVEWVAKFNCAGTKESELVEFVSKEVFQAGLAAVQERFG